MKTPDFSALLRGTGSRYGRDRERFYKEER